MEYQVFKKVLCASAVSLCAATPLQAASLSAPIIAAVLSGATELPTHLPDDSSSLPQLERVVTTPAYADGIGAMVTDPDRPNARSLSDTLSQPQYEQTESAPLSNLAVAMFQLIASHEIARSPTDASDPAPISVPAGSTGFPSVIPMSRSSFDGGTSVADPRQQLTDVTPAFDGSTVYGSTAAREAQLRSGVDGKLLVGTGGDVPIISGVPSAGDMRADENPSLRALHALFIREHNRIADEINAACGTDGSGQPNCSDDEIFNGARVIVANIQHKIFYDELLPLFLGGNSLDAFIPDSSVLAGVEAAITEFTTAAGRIGHTQVPDVILTGSPGAPLNSVALKDCFFDASCLDPATQTERLYGMAQQEGAAVDTFVVDSLRNNQLASAGGPLIDLFATNIERGRDHGLSDYETVRAALGFAPVELDVLLPQYVLDAYAGKDSAGIDLLVGLFSEFRTAGDYLGETGKALWALQFRNLFDTVLSFTNTVAQTEMEDWLSGVSMTWLLSRDSGYDPSVWGNTPFLAPSGSSSPVPLPPAVLLSLGGLAFLRLVARKRAA